MTIPSWQDRKYGSMIRAALWLETEVGEGKIFTKAQLREAFPDVAQIDRRTRDLRNYGWQIDTHRDDDRLRQEEQRYAKKGAEVWIPDQKKSNTKVKTSLSAAQRTRVMQGDDFLCRSCGISAGESYPDGQDAQLDVARRMVVLKDGSTDVQLVTECNRCRIGGRGRVDDVVGLLTEVRRLSGLERKVLASWIDADRRTPSQVEGVWGRYRALPAESRVAIAQAAAADQE